MVLLLFPIFFSLLMFFQPLLGVEEEKMKENGLGKTPEHPVSAGQGQENCSLNTASLKPKSQPKAGRRGGEKKKKRDGKLTNKVAKSHSWGTFLSLAVAEGLG